MESPSSSTVNEHGVLIGDGATQRLGHAIATAAQLQKRIGDRSSAPVRRVFIARAPGAEAVPLLARVLRSGRGGGVRLKLLLSLLWVAVGKPHDVSLPARTWATLLGLKDPEGAGARQVRSGFSWLASNSFVRVKEVPGQPSVVRLLDESANGRPYVLPAVAFKKAKMAEHDPDHHIYVRLPSAFWTWGWAVRLSGPGTAMLLVLLDARGARAGDRELWFSPSVAEARYALSENTRTAGLSELAEAGLVAVHRRAVNPDSLNYRRVRNTYTLLLDNLTRPSETDLSAS